MEQREVQDNENVRWSCVQALADPGSLKNAKQTESNGEVIVVCTPSGGAQTVRIQMPSDWFTKFSDEQLLRQIERNR